MAGLFLLGLGALLWLSADLRDEWRKLDAIDRHLVDTGRLPGATPASDHADAPIADTDRTGRVVPRPSLR